MEGKGGGGWLLFVGLCFEGGEVALLGGWWVGRDWGEVNVGEDGGEWSIVIGWE